MGLLCQRSKAPDEANRLIGGSACLPLWGLAALLVVIVLYPTLAHGTPNPDAAKRPYSSLVVQNRKFAATHELSLLFGILPMDAFTKGLTLSTGYTLHFNELFAWEIGQFHYSFHVDTDLKDELRAFDTPLKPTPFELLNYYISSNLIVKPLYWKGSWLNSSLTHGEAFLSLGGAYGWFTRSSKPGVSLGGGMRLFVSRLVSFRLDLRYLMFFGDKIFERFDVNDELYIGLGTSIAF